MRTLNSFARLFFLLLLALFIVACGSPAAPVQTGQGTATATTAAATPTTAPALDFYGTPIAIPATAPQRIIALVPTASDMLAALGLDSRVIAVDFYTLYPDQFAALPKVSDATGKYNVEQIVSLKPDLVLSHGGTTKQYDTQLKGLGLNVVDLPMANYSQSLEQLLIVGNITHTQGKATSVYNELQQQTKQIKDAVASATAPKVLIELDYSIPGKPYVSGGGSFGDELLQIANAVNVFHDNTEGGGYPQVTDEAVIQANPQFIILTADPKYGGDAAKVYERPNWGSIDALKLKQVYNVNGDLVSHPGPRLVQGLQCVAQVVHPDKFSTPLPDYCAGRV